MNILHLVHQFLPDHIGGVELYTAQVAAASVAAGDQVTVFTRVDRDEHGFQGLKITVAEWPDDFMEEAAMGIISNASDWNMADRTEWQDAARKWLDAYSRQ